MSSSGAPGTPKVRPPLYRGCLCDCAYIVGASAAILENSSGVKARTVVVRAFPEAKRAVTYFAIASPLAFQQWRQRHSVRS